MQMQVSDPRLRYGMQAQPLGFLAKEARDQSFHHVGFDFFREALANDRGRDVTAPEAWDTRYLLILLDQGFGLAVDVRERNLDFDLALGGAFFRGAVFAQAFLGVFLGRSSFVLAIFVLAIFVLAFGFSLFGFTIFDFSWAHKYLS